MKEWSEMLPEVLDIITQKYITCYEDYMSFAGVCKSWCLEATRTYHNSNGPPSRLPSLMLAKKSDDHESRELFLLSNKSIRKIRLPEIDGKAWWYSSCGWLLTSGKDFASQLINPISREIINLPKIDTFLEAILPIRWEYPISKAKVECGPSHRGQVMAFSVFGFDFARNNIYGTHVLLEACKVSGQIRRIIYVSTDEVYGETEEDMMLLLVIMKLHNFSQQTHIQPQKLQQKCLLWLLGEVGHVYNIGTKRERRVIDVAKDMCKLFNMDANASIMFVENRPFNDQRYFLDDEKLKSLGWSKRTRWEEGLKKTIGWYTSNPNWWGDVSGTMLPHPRMLMTPGGVDRLADGPGHTEFDVADPTINTAQIGVQTETIRTNVTGTLNLADVCREHGLLMINYASGCIIDYDDKHPEGSVVGFKEEETPNFTSFYSKTKAMVNLGCPGLRKKIHPISPGVCKSWRLAAARTYRNSNGPPSRLPSLMLADKSDDQEFCELFLLSNKSICKTRLPEAYGMTPRSSCGWLLTIREDFSSQLINHLSREIINLPKLDTITKAIHYSYLYGPIQKVVLLMESKLVFAIWDYDNLGFCHIGDNKWTSVEPTNGIRDITFYNGLVYSIDRNNNILACIVNGKDPAVLVDVATMPQSYIHQDVGKVYIVGLDDDKRKQLLVIYKEETEDTTRMIKGNCIYYTDDVLLRYTPSEYTDMGIYHLSDETIEPYFAGESRLDVTPPIWLQPM
nr:hypothetical protein [Tanacetum cinerariifolium]